MVAVFSRPVCLISGRYRSSRHCRIFWIEHAALNVAGGRLRLSEGGHGERDEENDKSWQSLEMERS